VIIISLLLKIKGCRDIIQSREANSEAIHFKNTLLLLLGPKLEESLSSETSENIYCSTRRNIPEELNVCLHSGDRPNTCLVSKELVQFCTDFASCTESEVNTAFAMRGRTVAERVGVRDVHKNSGRRDSERRNKIWKRETKTKKIINHLNPITCNKYLP